VFNLGGSLASIDELITVIESVVPAARGLLTFDEQRLPFPEEIDDTGLEVLRGVRVTPLAEAVQRTVDIFGAGLARGDLDPELAS
jgi:hypothetical protein